MSTSASKTFVKTDEGKENLDVKKQLKWLFKNVCFMENKILKLLENKQ